MLADVAQDARLLVQWRLAFAANVLSPEEILAGMDAMSEKYTAQGGKLYSTAQDPRPAKDSKICRMMCDWH